MTINLYGWNCLVVDRYRLEKYALKAGDVFIYRGSVVYQVDEPASLYVHAFLEPKQSAQQPMVELTNTLGEVKSLLKVVLDQSVTCPMAGCGYTPWANVSKDNIAKHQQREHGIRREPWRETVKGGVPVSTIVLIRKKSSIFYYRFCYRDQMFSELMEPNDINNYYDDIEQLFKLGAVDGTPRTPPSVTNPAVPSAVKTTPPAKQTFEVRPDAVFDGRSVGRQPAYNILRSGPPAVKYCNRPSWRSNILYYG
ncbi:hypothetical protein PC129_g18998 [Phytophthora cactorum]|uniref:Uncharacterized protein n=1 Tax=Phytophthora cactorum TaxID=29920 RepID=A0A329RTY0_9STRA|nr:hypothetical protein Pcac1_g13293 [Phytophthora cactorum]KAG2822189.1 hypothetical protein PC112_g11053 [Phytophthora cactorum]KAG2879854.1 hypothetical protein PC114_g22352 [Phytophthora cactorum]KAG2947925.1 hypothetical protein PC117_g6448 [Phytophthora cactorum]KAG2966337.1 hypothetical protein PC118_g19247 [Phytophthora cactorum]